MDIERENIEKALKCLFDNGIEKDECPVVLQALCYILFDIEIDDYLAKIDFGNE